jgi:hypothetical protein
MLSRPVGVRWAGWESNTFQLQQAGWELAVEYEPIYDKYRLLVHHRQGTLYGMSHANILERQLSDPWSERMPPAFELTGLARSLEVISEHHMEPLPFANFIQIDATPQLTERKIHRIEDFNIFKTITTRAEEIIIEKADMTVIEHLEAIKDLQSASQAEIRDRILKDRRRGSADQDVSPEVEIHTNIVQLRPAS